MCFSAPGRQTAVESKLLSGSVLHFTQADEGGVYQNAPQDKGANGGIQKMQQSKLNDVTECPAGGYLHHWFSVEANGVYCVLARDGHHYAESAGDVSAAETIAFDWMYQPAASAVMSPIRFGRCPTKVALPFS
jgi:hypothetical protein